MWPNICDFFRNRFVSRSETQCKQEEEVNPFFFLFNKKDKCKNASPYNKSRRKKGKMQRHFLPGSTKLTLIYI